MFSGAFTQFSCLYTSHVNNHTKRQLGDYGEETVSGGYDSLKDFHDYQLTTKDIPASWPFFTYQVIYSLLC